MIRNAFNGLAEAIGMMIILLCIFVPLGLWKMVELMIWCYEHIKVNIL